MYIYLCIFIIHFHKYIYIYIYVCIFKKIISIQDFNLKPRKSNFFATPNTRNKGLPITFYSITATCCLRPPPPKKKENSLKLTVRGLGSNELPFLGFGLLPGARLILLGTVTFSGFFGWASAWSLRVGICRSHWKHCCQWFKAKKAALQRMIFPPNKFGMEGHMRLNYTFLMA